MSEITMYNTSMEYKNFSSNIDPADEERKSSKHAMLVAYILIMCLGFCANLKVIYVVMVQLRRSKRQRPVNLLVAHLSLLSILGSVINMFNTSNMSQFLSLRGPLCELMSYLKNVLSHVFAMNTVFIVHERIQSIEQQNENKRLVPYILLFIWLCSLLFSIPNVMMTKSVFDVDFSGTTGNCEPINLMDSLAATIAFEVSRFVLFTLVVTGCIFKAMKTLRDSLNFLQQESDATGERLDKRVRSVRLVYYHFMTMTFFWVPSGLYLLAHRICSRLDPPLSLDSLPTLLKALCVLIIFFTFLFLQLNPIISLCLLESNIARANLGNCFLSFDRNPSSISTNISEEIPLADLNASSRHCNRERNVRNASASRYSTVVAFTSEE